MNKTRLAKLFVALSLFGVICTTVFGWGEGYTQETDLVSIDETPCYTDGDSCSVTYYYDTWCDFGGPDAWGCTGGPSQEVYSGTCYVPVPGSGGYCNA